MGEFQFFYFGVVDGFGAVVGDVPGAGEVFAAAAEAEGEVGLDARAGDSVVAVEGGVVDADGAGFVLDGASAGGRGAEAHLGSGFFADEVDAAVLGVLVGLDKGVVEGLVEVSLGGGEVGAGGI